MTVPQAIQLTCAKCGAVNRVPTNRLADRPVCGKCKVQLLDGGIINASDGDFSRCLRNNDLPLVVDFWAPWCGPCVSFAPVFAEVAKDWSTRARFLKLDTERNPSVAGLYQIRSIPTLVVFHRGKEVARLSGALPKGQFEQWLMGSVSKL